MSRVEPIRYIDGMTGASRPLPSQDAAERLLAGEPNGLRDSIASTAVRAGLIAGGLYVAGRRGRDLVREAAYGALAVELAVLGWCAATKTDGGKP